MRGNFTRSIQLVSNRARILSVVGVTAIAGVSLAVSSAYGLDQDASGESASQKSYEVKTVQSTSDQAQGSPSDASEGAVEAPAQASAPDPTMEASGQTTLSVNDRQVPLPDKGTLHTTINDDNGTTSVDFSTQSTSSGETSSHTSLTVTSQSTSETSSQGVDDE